MNVTYEKKDAMTFIGYHTEIRPEEGYQKCPGILGQGIRREIRPALADQAAGKRSGKSDPGKRDRHVRDLRRR